MMFVSWTARTTPSTNVTPKPPHSLPQPDKQRGGLCFCYLDHFKVLVCVEHATGVQNIETHLRDHHTLTQHQRRDIVAQYGSLERAKPQDVALPAPGKSPFPVLGAPLEAYRCSASRCNYITTSLQKLRRHYKGQHGEPWKGDVSTRFDRVKVQSFFRAVQRYFVVLTPSPVDTLNNSSGIPSAVDQRLAQWQETQQLHEEETQVMEAEVAKTDKTGWYKRTGWLEHFANRNLAHLAHQLRLPDQRERKIQQAARLTELLLARSVGGLSTLSRETRRWLKSAKRHEVDARPMDRLQNPESEARYTGYMVKFVCYFLRIIADEEQRTAGSRCEAEQEDYDSNESDAGSEIDKSDDSDVSSSQRPRARQSIDMMKDARELFCWHGRQKELAIQLWSLLDGQHNEDVESRALLDVLSSFIFQHTGDQPFRSGLLHFTAVLGIDRETRRMRTAKNYSYMLAGVVYCVRVLAVEATLPTAERDSLSDEAADEAREHFLERRRRFLADGCYSPMSECLSLLAYGKAVALATGNAGSTSWSADKKIFYLHGRPIHLSHFRTMAHDLIVEAETMLWQKLLWSPPFTIPLKKVVDDIMFTQRGRSFVDHRDNGLGDGLRWTLTQVEQRAEAQKLQRGTGEWSVVHVKQYLRAVDRFLELLLISVHITSGQPGRGSEVLTMRHRNGLLQDRNVFVQDGQVMTVVRYHKSQSQWDKPKVVPRFLPPRLGQVMVVYLAYLQPFREYLIVQVLGGGFSDYLWGGNQGPWETDRLTRVLRRETGKRLWVELGTLDYRHTAVGLGRVVVGESFARGYQDGEGEADEEEVEDEGEDILELQNARSTLMGVGNYGVRADIVQHLSVRSIDAFRALSTLWHDFLGVNESSGQGAGKAQEEEAWTIRQTSKRRLSVVDRTVPRDRPFPAPVVRAEDTRTRDTRLEKAMQQALGHEVVGFRSAAQEQAMHAVLDGQTPLVVILPTGGGKSLLFMVPACLDSNGVTVVVVPYRALIHSLVDRIQKRGIDCREWTRGDHNPASVVVVSADVAGDITSPGNFMGYATMLSSKGLLRRVVVDECHLVITSSDWRPKLAQLKNLRLLLCPMVLLTATLPPVREADLSASMMVHTATYIRANTVRPRTRYVVSWCKPGEAHDAVVAMCRREAPRLLRQGLKGIVYACSKAQCEAIAEELKCAYYHAEVADRADRLEDWLRDGGWIVATSALGTGVDFPGVVFIVHAGMPWSIIDHAQESGRGGRAGEWVDAVIVVEHGEVERRMRQKSDDLDVQAMGTFILGDGCRRALLSSYLDGRRIECRDIESAGCDRCGEGAGEWQESQRERNSEWQAVEALLDELREGCGICAMLDEGGLPEAWREHKAMLCTGPWGLDGQQVDSFRRMVMDGCGHSCRRCWVSQKFCATGRDVKNPCQWPNVVIPIVRAAAMEPHCQKMIRDCGFNGNFGPDWREYATWLGRKHSLRIWGECFSNAMVVLIRVLLFIHRSSYKRQ